MPSRSRRQIHVVADVVVPVPKVFLPNVVSVITFVAFFVKKVPAHEAGVNIPQQDHIPVVLLGQRRRVVIVVWAIHLQDSVFVPHMFSHLANTNAKRALV